MNSHAAAYISPVVDDLESELVIGNGLVEVRVASAQVLLAMKIRASRPRLDTDDIKTLLEHLGIRDLASALEIYHSYYPEDPLPDRAKPLLESIMARKSDLPGFLKPRL